MFSLMAGQTQRREVFHAVGFRAFDVVNPEVLSASASRAAKLVSHFDSQLSFHHV